MKYLMVFVAMFLYSPVSAHDAYGGWTSDTGGSCCSERKEDANGNMTGDCRPVRAYQNANGDWVAVENGVEIEIPERAISPDKSPDGRSHICESAGYVFCFRPGEVRS